VPKTFSMRQRIGRIAAFQAARVAWNAGRLCFQTAG